MRFGVFFIASADAMREVCFYVSCVRNLNFLEDSYNVSKILNA